MGYIFIALLALVIAGLVLWIFLNTDPKAIIHAFKLIIPVGLMAVGVIATIAGRGQFGIPAIVIAGIWWYYFMRPGRSPGD